MAIINFSLLLTFSLLLSLSSPSPLFEGFEPDNETDGIQSQPSDQSISNSNLNPGLTKLDEADFEESKDDEISIGFGNNAANEQYPDRNLDKDSILGSYWDEDEFEGYPIEEETKAKDDLVIKNSGFGFNATNEQYPDGNLEKDRVLGSYYIEGVSFVFLVLFAGNYFVGKRENERIALAWAGRFATKGSVFDKSFGLLGVGDGKDEDSPLLLKEGVTGFKLYATGRRYCQGMVATMELKSRHDLISRVVNMVIPRRDEITFEVYMNEESMDHVVFALAKNKKVKAMAKEETDLARFGGLLAAPGGKRWVVDELAVVAESKEVAGDLITAAVLEQVFGDKVYESYGKHFISLHFSDQHVGRHRKALIFKFSLPNAKNMTDMTRLIALVPYYIDLIGRYKLSSPARSKTETVRQKVAQEMYREFQSARQEVLQKKKAERRKFVEEAEAKLSAEAIRKKESKERARQAKKAMPKVKTARGS